MATALAVTPEPKKHSTEQQRVLTMKVFIDWKAPASKALYERIRDLSWQAARYRNLHMQGRWAESMGWQTTDQEKSGITKQLRKTEKAELSGAAYSAAEREVQGAWTRHAKAVMAGQPIPQWKTNAALSIRGHKFKKDSGVRLEFDGEQYFLDISAQSDKSEDGCWLRLPIAKNTKRDEYQAELLQSMVNWSTPIAKAIVIVKRNCLMVKLSYAKVVPLPIMGQRVATLGPVTKEGRLLLRTECETKDYTHKLAQINKKKDHWDLIRRRAMCQIGRRKGHARIKREVLARLSWDDWLHTFMHTWSREIVDWLDKCGVGTLHIVGIDTGDWPAFKFVQLLSYKAADARIQVDDLADVNEAGGERAIKRVIGKKSLQVKKRNVAVRELTHQLGN